MSQAFVNRKASQALRGETVIVTVDSTDQANLHLISKGQLATLSSNSKTGTVGRVDYFGNSFQVTPIQPDRDLSSVTPYGYLANGETITVTI